MAHTLLMLLSSTAVAIANPTGAPAGPLSGLPGIPKWNTTIPDPTLPWAGLPRLPAEATTVHSVYRAEPSIGTYNHGPMIVEFKGVIIVNWYAGQQDEDAPGERVLFASSTDGGATFTRPLPMFDRLSPTGSIGSAGVLVSNHEFAVCNGRLYAVGQAHQCNACPTGSVSGRSAGLIRRVYVDHPEHAAAAGVVRLGPAVWQSSSRTSVPEGPAAWKIPLMAEVSDPQLRADAEALIQQRISTVPVPAPAGVQLNERSVYQRTFLSQIQLVMLLRCTGIQFEWASICNLYLQDAPARGVKEQQLPCNWSVAVPTSIPDAHTRTHVGTLPDGHTYLLGTQVSNTSLRHKRDPLTLSLSPDGESFTQAWALRYGAPDKRYNGSHKDYGFAYPSAIVDRQNQLMHVAYSVNKEDIELLTIPLSALAATSKPTLDNGAS